jgi:hypothetical protein
MNTAFLAANLYFSFILLFSSGLSFCNHILRPGMSYYEFGII